MDHAPATIDHLVLPVRDLDLARARYEALGFRVAAEARHPFGTENACIFLQDGTYLEPLALWRKSKPERATRFCAVTRPIGSALTMKAFRCWRCALTTLPQTSPHL